MKNTYILYICRASLHRIRLNTVCTDSLESSCSINTLYKVVMVINVVVKTAITYLFMYSLTYLLGNLSVELG